MYFYTFIAIYNFIISYKSKYCLIQNELQITIYYVEKKYHWSSSRSSYI